MTSPGGVRHRTDCRLCSADVLEPLITLGSQPLANALLASPEDFADEPRYPLDLRVCAACLHVQLADVVDPARLFADYPYETGVSSTMREHFRAYAATITRRHALTPGDRVVEIASNDGTLLRAFAALGLRAGGVEPAANLAARTRAEGLEVVDRFFDASTAPGIRERFGPARAVVANNVLAHVDDPVGFLAGCRVLAEPDGVVIVEVPSLDAMIEALAYDQIYHEHLSYFSGAALVRAFARAGLRVDSIERQPVHVGSLRVTGAVAREGAASGPGIAAEPVSRAALDRFAARVDAHRESLRAAVVRRRAAGARVAAYGASAKGAVLLNACGLGRDDLEFVVDRSPLKVGRFAPGSHLPIRPREALERERPDVVLLLAWNLAAEVLAQEHAFRVGGGRFLLPLPEIREV